MYEDFFKFFFFFEVQDVFFLEICTWTILADSFLIFKYELNKFTQIRLD